MPYIVKCTFINKDEDGNVTYNKGRGVTCYSKESAEDYYNFLNERSYVKDVVIEKV